VETTKKCGKCLKTKSLNEYSSNPAGKYGKKSICKTCAKLYYLSKIKGVSKYYDTLKKYHNTHKAEARNRYFIKEYGITQENYDKMYAENNGTCLICGEYYGKLFVDHDHKTGTVRGLLCSNCNAGLGFFKDNIDRIERAAYYLKRNLGA